MEAITTIRITKALAEDLKALKEEWRKAYGFIPNYELLLRTLISSGDKTKSPTFMGDKK